MNSLTLFFTILFTEFIAEMGDKTQFMLVAMTSRYKLKNIILGTAIANLVLNGIAILAGGFVNEFIPDYVIKLIAAAAFLYFSVSSLAKNEDEEEAKNTKFKLEAVAVFCTFFVAELGDKTQLTAITFGATYGMQSAVLVWLACSAGLYLADMVGLVVGYLLKSKTTAKFLNTLAVAIFAIFGFITLNQGLGLIPGENKGYTVPVIIVVAIAFVIACSLICIKSKKQKEA